MQIHVARNSAQLGVFAPEEIVAGLQSGRFHASDLAWHEGLDAWTPLGDWSEFRGVGVPPPSPNAASFAQGAVETPPMPSWERGASMANFIATIKEVALDPVRTFANLREGGFARPISFTYWTLVPAWICGSLLYGGLIVFMLNIGKLASAPKDPAMEWFSGFDAFGAVAIMSAALGFVFLLTPLFNFVGAGVTHLLLLPWKPAGSYAQTYRAGAYAYGAFMPFVFVPCLNYVVIPWQLVASVVAHSQVHRLAWWKVVISLVVVPCCCVCGLYALMIPVFMASLSKLPH